MIYSEFPDIFKIPGHIKNKESKEIKKSVKPEKIKSSHTLQS